MERDTRAEAHAIQVEIWRQKLTEILDRAGVPYRLARTRAGVWWVPCDSGHGLCGLSPSAQPQNMCSRQCSPLALNASSPKCCL